MVTTVSRIKKEAELSADLEHCPGPLGEEMNSILFELLHF